MTEHLFKLKKDGKTVGYMQLQKQHKPSEYLGLLWRFSSDGNTRWTGQKARWPIFDTAHSFIIKDKNGKDVFADDKIKGFLEDSTDEIKGEVTLYEKTGAYRIKTGSSLKPRMLFVYDIELIEEKKDI